MTILAELLADETASDRRLISGYLEAKRSLAKAYEDFARQTYGDAAILESVKATIEHAMRMTYGQVPEKYLRVTGFGRVHAMLLAYLVPRVGTDVYADELRMLTGDAVHTERRARDLRDLGFVLDTVDHPRGQVYRLRDAVPAVDRGAAVQLQQNIRSDKRLSPFDKRALLESAGFNESV